MAKDKKQPDGENRLLLHTCCADCAVKSLSALGTALPKYQIILYFGNSNIHPRSEWLARLNAMKTIAKDRGIELVTGDWSPKDWFKAIDHNPENTGLRRCRLCWEQRLEEAASYAEKTRPGLLSTSLLSSHYQNTDIIIEIGYDVSKRHGLEFITYEPDKDMQTRGFYKQNYCGCCYSLTGRYEQKFKPSI